MGLSASDAAMRRQAAADLAEKLRLEGPLSTAMRSFFGEVRKDLVAIYTHTGKMQNLKELYEPDVTAILKKHYRRVFKSFGSHLRTQLKKSFAVDLTKSTPSDQVDAELSRLVDDRAGRQSDFILNTTHKELGDAIEQVLDAAQKNGEDLSHAEVAARVARIVTPGQQTRADVIAVTETNGAAELAKYTEASILANSGTEVGGVDLKEQVVKQWDSILDEKTRLWHAVADGQRRAIDDPFDVNGEQLMTPGDDSLGASADNLINCRCSSQYVVGDATVL